MSATEFDTVLDKTIVNPIRVALGVGGALALIIGILILAWPGKTAVVVAGIIAAYAAIGGFVNIAVGIFAKRLGTWPRIGYLLLGLLFLIAAVVAFANLQAAAAWLAVLIGIMVGIVWIVEGVVGLTLVGDSSSKVWTVVLAALSILAGIVLVASPLWGAAILWLLLGISLVVLGVVQIVRAFTFGSATQKA